MNTGVKVWVVTNPTTQSTQADCVFTVDAMGMVLQVRGGLGPEDTPAFHLTERDAVHDFAQRLVAIARAEGGTR